MTTRTRAPMAEGHANPGLAGSRQAGFSLIIVVGIIAMLSFMGVLVLNTAWLDTEQAGAEREFNAALYVAEAGIAWGVDKLDGAPYLLSADVPNRDAITTGTPVVAADACPDGGACLLLSWYRLDADVPGATPDWITYGTRGSFSLYAALDTDNTTATRWRIFLRSIGRATGGSSRMIEVAIGPVSE